MRSTKRSARSATTSCSACQFGSRLEGHPSPVLPWVDVATGSLGFGLPVGAGIALAAKTIDPRPYRVWVLAGDSEMAEGSVWEAFEHAAHWRLDNLTVIVDVNRLGQSGETMHGRHLMSYAERACSFGWAAFPIDGHDLEAIDDAYAEAIRITDRPSVIVAETRKGRGVAAVEDEPGWHGKVLPDPQAAIAWSGGVKTSLKTDVQAKTLIGLGSGESFQLGFSGQGWVLVQPSEGRPVAA